MSVVCSEKVLSPVEYLKIIFPDENFPITTVNMMMSSNDVRNLLDNKGRQDLWDYPLDEIDEIVENKCFVALVHFDDGNEEEYRWFEVDRDIKPELSRSCSYKEANER